MHKPPVQCRPAPPHTSNACISQLCAVHASMLPAGCRWRGWKAWPSCMCRLIWQQQRPRRRQWACGAGHATPTGGRGGWQLWPSWPLDLHSPLDGSSCRRVDCMHASSMRACAMCCADRQHAPDLTVLLPAHFPSLMQAAPRPVPVRECWPRHQAARAAKGRRASWQRQCRRRRQRQRAGRHVPATGRASSLADEFPPAHDLPGKPAPPTPPHHHPTPHHTTTTTTAAHARTALLTACLLPCLPACAAAHAPASTAAFASWHMPKLFALCRA